MIGTRPAKRQFAAAWSAGIGTAALAALLGACANGNAAGIQGQFAAQPSEPVIVTAPTQTAPPVAVTPPSTTTTLPTTTAATTTSTTHPTTTIPTTTTTTLPVVKPPAFPVTPLKRGASGDAVKVAPGSSAQTRLLADNVDGHYGSATTQAVMAFQKYYGISDRSGRVDQATANALTNARTKLKAQSHDGLARRGQQGASRCCSSSGTARRSGRSTRRPAAGKPYSDEQQEGPDESSRATPDARTGTSR